MRIAVAFLLPCLLFVTYETHVVMLVVVMSKRLFPTVSVSVCPAGNGSPERHGTPRGRKTQNSASCLLGLREWSVGLGPFCWHCL